MAKISEKISFDHDHMVIKQRHDVSQALKDVRMAKDAGIGMSGEKRLAGLLRRRCACLMVEGSWCIMV